ncbi:MAG: LptA/OstA family protein [Myxococcota bacterium]
MTPFLFLLLASTPDAGPAVTPRALARPVEVAADALEILGKENQAIYSGHARAKRDSATITCERIHVFYRGQDILRIEATGGVEVTDGDRWAKGERADFDNLTGVLVVTGAPQARQGKNQVEGSKVTFTVGSDLLEVDDARTLFTDAPVAGTKQERVRIDAKRLTLLGQKNQAVWSGKVRARRGTAEIFSEELIAHYTEGGAQEVTRLTALRGVEVKDGERWAQGDRADFDNRRGVLVLTGNPQARQGKNHLKGSRVELTVGTERLEVQDAVTVFEPEVLEEKR